MSYPTPPTQYPRLKTEELQQELCNLTSALIAHRADHARLAAEINEQFFQIFLDANGESVAARNRLAEAATSILEQERLVVEANVLCHVDLIALIRTLLDRR